MSDNDIATDPPIYDDAGINLADPHDRLGRKTEYISKLQLSALAKYVGRGSGLALDLGCGYGRMTRGIAALGYDILGLDPSLRVLKYAAQSNPELSWCVGKLPQLPFLDGTFELVMFLNVIRPLHLLGIKSVCSDVARVVARRGRLVVLDNVRAGDSRYVEERWFSEFFTSHGLRLTRRVAIRSSRSPLIYLIRYGLIPRSWLDRLAAWELSRMSSKTRAPRWDYHNVIFVFERE